MASRGARSGAIPRYGSKRISYSEYANGGYSPSEKIPGTYDKETKTVEVRTYPRIEKAAEIIPQSAIDEWAKALGVDKRRATIELFTQYAKAASEGATLEKTAQPWERKLWNFVKKYNR